MEQSASSVSLDNLSNIFTSFIDNLQLVIDQVQDGESGRDPDPDFNLDSFWKRTELVAQIISKESTTLCVAFIDSSIPTPQNCSMLVEALEKSVIAMVSAFYSLPKRCGITLRKQVQASVINLMVAVQKLVKVIQTEGGQGGQVQKTRTGNVWERCDEFENLPHDNIGAYLKVSHTTSGLVRDALEEIQEELESESNGLPGELDDGLSGELEEINNEDTWCEADKTLIAPCIGMIKATKSCLKKAAAAVKAGGSCESDEMVAQLDDLADTIQELSPHVDDLIFSLYAPMNHQTVYMNVTTLSTSLKQLLIKIKNSHVSTEEDISWIEFLRKAVEHNLDKVKGLVPHGEPT